MSERTAAPSMNSSRKVTSSMKTYPVPSLSSALRSLLREESVSEGVSWMNAVFSLFVCKGEDELLHQGRFSSSPETEEYEHSSRYVTVNVLFKRREDFPSSVVPDGKGEFIKSGAGCYVCQKRGGFCFLKVLQGNVFLPYFPSVRFLR